MNYVKSVVSASVSLGQFYRYLVRIHHGTPLDAENDFVQIPLHDDDEEGKEKREENTQRVKKEHINVPSVSAARTTNKSSFVVFEGEKGSALMVREWFKTRSKELNFCEV